MSFAGTVASMISSLKNNARPKRRYTERFGKIENHYHIPLKEKAISNADLDRVKNEIQHKLVARNRKHSFITLSLLSVILFFLIYLLVNSALQTKENYRKQEQAYRLEQQRKQEKIQAYLKEGNKAVDQKDYPLAKRYFNRALFLDDKNYEISLALSRVYLLDCIENNKECELYEIYKKASDRRYGMARVNNDLGDLLDQLKIKKAEEQRNLNEEVNKLLNRAYSCLDQKNYSKAKKYVQKAYFLDNDNFNANVAIAKVYIMDCVINKNDCKLADYYYKILKYKYEETIEFQDIKMLWESKNQSAY